jgi:DNA modification methylase
MLNEKNIIEHLKQNDLPELYRLLSERKDIKELLHVLENLGHLPRDFDGDVLIPLTKHTNAQVKFWAVKNLAKLENYKYANVLYEIAQHDNNTIVRREATSALGRMRDKRLLPCLLDLLSDYDPKVVLQAVRGLLVFKDLPDVSEALQGLQSHQNETIQSVIAKEFSSGQSSTLVKRKISPVDLPNYIRNLVVNGDVSEIIQLIPDESIHLTFTSPPYYNARDYAIYASYQEYLDFLTDVFQQVHRITQEGRFFVLNTSPVIVPRVSRAHSSKRYPIPFDIHPRLVEMGWEFIDDIVWVKPEASVKNRNGGFLQHRKPLAYKPNAVTEYLMVYRKQTDKLIDWNIRQYSDKIVNESKVTTEYETTNVWHIDPTFDRVHTAVFPFELCKRVIQYYSYVGDVIFDPFAGSGTVGKVAVAMGRDFLLTEQDSTYFERIRESLGTDLFSKAQFLTFDDLNQLLKG